jgi:nucleoside-diphosphate-sugar epimerase
MPSILVTGATGFLGARIVRQLVHDGLPVRATSRARSSIAAVEHVVADLTTEPLTPVVAGCDVVIHAAGLAHQFNRSPRLAGDFHANNALATERLAEAAARAGVKRFVLASSVSVYGGAQTGLVDETALCRPSSDYARSKLEAERQLLEVCRHSAMQPLILRLATLYGEGDRGNVARLMSAIDRGRFVWIGRGRNRKSLLHVDDAVHALVLAAVSSPNLPHEHDSVFNVAAEPVAMRQVVELLAAALGCSAARFRMPAWPAWLALSTGTCLPWLSSRAARWQQTLGKWLDDDAYCGRRFGDAYGFQPQVELAEGIGRQVRARRAQGDQTTARRAA